jgi:uncharacterized membrane protein
MQLTPEQLTVTSLFLPVSVPLLLPAIEWISSEPFLMTVTGQVQPVNVSVSMLPRTVSDALPVFSVLPFTVEVVHVLSIGPATKRTVPSTVASIVVPSG